MSPSTQFPPPSSVGSQCQQIYDLLKTGPQRTADFATAGINVAKLTARLADLRVRLRPRGIMIEPVPGEKGMWQLIVPEST